MHKSQFFKRLIVLVAASTPLNLYAHSDTSIASATALSPCSTRSEIEPPFAKNPRDIAPEELLARYIQVNTTNPPGCEGKAARFWKKFFDKYAVESSIVELPYGTDRANILARVPSQTKKQRPIIMLNHMDVVPAETSHWRVPPFSGEVKDGYIYGRGTVDMKATAVYQALMLVYAKTENWALDRDIIFLGTANEEGPVDLENGVISGAEWMLKNRLTDLDNAEFVLTEGGSISLKDGQPQTWEISPGEKARLELTFRMPNKNLNSTDSFLVMARVANRIITQFNSKIHAPSSKERSRIAQDSAATAQFSTTRALTILGGIGKGNTIPSQSEAVIEFTANAKDHELLTTGLSNILPPSITLEAGIKTQDRIQFRLRSNGIAAHASEPPLDGGANALLVRLIANIERSIMLKKSVATSFRVERLAAIAEQAASTSPSFAIDFRLHPKDSRATVMKQIEKLVGGEMEFKITEDAVIAPQSSTNNALFRALSAAHKHFERSSPIKSKIETPILTSTTDAAFFRQKGMTVYGFEPLPIDPDDDNSHGDNERILVSSVRFATDVMEFTLKNL